MLPTLSCGDKQRGQAVGAGRLEVSSRSSGRLPACLVLLQHEGHPQDCEYTGCSLNDLKAQ